MSDIEYGITNVTANGEGRNTTLVRFGDKLTGMRFVEVGGIKIARVHLDKWGLDKKIYKNLK